MLQALAIQKTEIKALSGAQKQTQFDYVKQRIFEQTGEIWQWEGAPKDGKWVRVKDATLTDAIAASDDSTASIESPVKEVVAIATVETLNDETGMNTQEAFLIAQQRGYKGNAKSFRDRFGKQDMAKDFGLRRIPHDGGREKWLYFDTKTQS
jgi:hypothetical protein